MARRMSFQHGSDCSRFKTCDSAWVVRGRPRRPIASSKLTREFTRSIAAARPADMCRKFKCGGVNRSANDGHISAGIFAASWVALLVSWAGRVGIGVPAR